MNDPMEITLSKFIYKTIREITIGENCPKTHHRNPAQEVTSHHVKILATYPIIITGVHFKCDINV